MMMKAVTFDDDVVGFDIIGWFAIPVVGDKR